MVHQIDDNIRKPVDERLVTEVMQSLQSKVTEMDAVKAKIDSRVNTKREYDYYVAKVPSHGTIPFVSFESWAHHL